MTVSAEKDLMATEHRWVQAHRNLNLADLEDILDDEYKRIDGDRVIDKQALLATYQSGQRHWDVAEGSDYSVQIVEDFAVVVGMWRGVGVNHGEQFDYRARFVAIYVKRQSGWKLYKEETFEVTQ